VTADQKKGAYEDQRDSAACFENRLRTEDWQAQFVGVMTIGEELKPGDKVWVHIWVRSSRRAEKYVSISIKRKES
jgi:hypothetical protein